MSTSPNSPGTEQEILDDETKRLLEERLKTIDEDDKKSVRWSEAKERILKKLEHPAPR